MSDIIGGGVVDRVTAEHVLAGHLAALGGQSEPQPLPASAHDPPVPGRSPEPRDDVGRHLVLSESRLLHWLIDDARGRPAATLRTNLTALGRYSQAITSAGLVARDLLAACGWRTAISVIRTWPRPFARPMPRLDSPCYEPIPSRRHNMGWDWPRPRASWSTSSPGCRDEPERAGTHTAA